jgi:hypothetical protein
MACGPICGREKNESACVYDHVYVFTCRTKSFGSDDYESVYDGKFVLSKIGRNVFCSAPSLEFLI